MLINGWPNFSGGSQQDAHELLLVMLEQLEEYRDHFVGHTATTSTCGSCGHQSLKVEEFNCLNVDIPTNRSHSAASVLSCVEESFSEEIVTEFWNCHEGCGAVNTCGKRQPGLSHLPSLLVIQLRRFTPSLYGYQKNQATVDLQDGFLMINGTQFQLTGVVNHIGSMDSGHYTASIRVNNRWKCCNDQRVKDDGALRRKSSAPYILFYERTSEEAA